MITSPEQFAKLLELFEDGNLEFKAARSNFSFEDTVAYCAALSNEGGGKLILGVDNSKHIVGTQAFFGRHNQQSNLIFERIHIRVEVEELSYNSSRILIFHIPRHPPGTAVSCNGKFQMRLGESLHDMDSAQLKKILNETDPDFSSQPVAGLCFEDLDSIAINNLRQQWAQKSNRPDFLSHSHQSVLSSLGLIIDNVPNYAALILVGTETALSRYLPCAEIIFEWRQSKKVSHDFRKTWRGPLLGSYDSIWETLNARNSRIPFQEGLIQREIYAFDEKAIREALLNAVAHRDYTIGGASIIIRASPDEFFIESPGGFTGGVTVQNVLMRTFWRNRRIAEVLEKAGLVERSGQGMDDIFLHTISDGKGAPDLLASDETSVRLSIPATVKDINFILFIEQIANERQISLSSEQLYELERMRVSNGLSALTFRDFFLENDLIENVGRGRGSKYILSHRYYKTQGRAGLHTRLTSLSREKKKEMILQHLQRNKQAVLSEFIDVFDDLKPRSVSNILQELKGENKIYFTGSKLKGVWRLKD